MYHNPQLAFQPLSIQQAEQTHSLKKQLEYLLYHSPFYKNHLRNTAGKEQNLHLTFGIIKTKFQSKFYLSNIYSKNGFFANAHGLEPRNVDTKLHDKSSRDIN